MPALLHSDEPSEPYFLQVVRDGGHAAADPAADLPYRKRSRGPHLAFLVCLYSAAIAHAAAQHLEDAQPGGIAKRLEDMG